MTLEQIDESLPNGLHDAQIQEVAMNYERARLILRVQVHVGLFSQPYPECERYRSGEITFQKVLFYSVELPQAGSSFQYPGTVWFSYERTPQGRLPAALAEAVPSQTHCYSLFIREWLSHIHVAASEVTFRWLDAEVS